MTKTMALLVGMCFFVGAGFANADFILYQTNFSGTEGQSISSEGWTNAETIVYSEGTAYRVAPQNNTTAVLSEYAFSHTLAPGETVTLTADVCGVYGDPDIGVGLRTESGEIYRAFSRNTSKQCLSVKHYDGVVIQPVSELTGVWMTYQIDLSADNVSFKMKKATDTSWTSLGSVAQTETGLSAIQLLSGFNSGTNYGYYGTYFRWDNIQLTSNVPEPATIGLLMLCGMILRRKSA
jgi:hypothetical protein